MNDALSYNQDLDDALARRGIEHTSETPPIEDLPIHVDLGGASIDFEKYTQFATEHLTHWFQLLEELHPRHICVVHPNIRDSVYWYKESQEPLPAHILNFTPEELKSLGLRDNEYELYDPEKDSVYHGKIGEKEYYLPEMRPGFKRVDYQVPKGKVAVIWPHDPGHRAGEMMLRDFERFIEHLGRCLFAKKTNPRFLVFPLLLIIEEDEFHANMMVIDSVQKTLTRFEPHGAGVEIYDPRDVDREVRRVLIPEIEFALGFSGVRVITPSDFCPVLGFQCSELLQTRYPKQTKVVSGKTVSAEKDGYCDAWSAMWLHYRILNPNKTDKQVYDMINAGWDDLATKIRAYITAIVTSFMDKLAKEKEDTLRGG